MDEQLHPTESHGRYQLPMSQSQLITVSTFELIMSAWRQID